MSGRFVRVVNSKRVTATVGGKKCYFRSRLEYRWALYLEFLRRHEGLRDWQYEPRCFVFSGEIKAPVQYRPDFSIVEPNGTEVYQECKGFHDGDTNSKLRKMAKHYPNVIMELVLQRMPKDGKGTNRRRVAAKYCRRVIDASEIFKQIKGLVDMRIPK